jgi:hypothetical protein
MHEHVVRSLFVMALAAVVLTVVFYVSTTQIFAVRVVSGIWWFALCMMLSIALGVLMAATHGARGIGTGHRVMLLLLLLGLVVASVVLGLRHRPFNPANIRFGALVMEGDDGMHAINVSDLPPARDEVNHEAFLPSVGNQGSCQSCWAMSAAAALSARKAMQDSAAGKPVAEPYLNTCIGDGTDIGGWHFSPQVLVDLDSVRAGGREGKCNPSYADQGLTLAALAGGVVSARCVPNFAGLEPSCPAACNAPSSKYFAVADNKITTGCFSAGEGPVEWTACADPSQQPTRLRATRPLRVIGQEAMKREISASGPIICLVNFYRKANGAHPAWTLADKALFGTAVSSIISPGFVARPNMDGAEYTKQFLEGGHSMTVYGYGVSGSGVPYWNVRNSWGGTWGDKGSIKIERGIDAWNIESACASSRVMDA